VIPFTGFYDYLSKTCQREKNYTRIIVASLVAGSQEAGWKNSGRAGINKWRIIDIFAKMENLRNV